MVLPLEEPPLLSRQRVGGIHIWAMGKGAETKSFCAVGKSHTEITDNTDFFSHTEITEEN